MRLTISHGGKSHSDLLLTKGALYSLGERHFNQERKIFTD